MHEAIGEPHMTKNIVGPQQKTILGLKSEEQERMTNLQRHKAARKERRGER